MKRILIISLFRNEEHSIPQYLAAIQKLRYPPELIDLYWLENDSSDNTLNLLKEAQPKMPFNSTTLKSIEILGPVKKRVAGGYIKDIGYGEGQVKPWLVIWNEYLTPLIRESKADYVLCWWADAIPPRNVIMYYLRVYKKYPDAGWVGGKMYRRYPKHNVILSPWPETLFDSKEITRCKMTGHVWMMPREAVAKCNFYRKGRDMHMSLVLDMEKLGLHSYFDPQVFIHHISNDGKVWFANENS